MNNIDENIKILEEWMESLEQIKLKIAEQEDYLFHRTHELFQVSWGKVRNKKKIEEIDLKRDGCVYKMRFLNYFMKEYKDDLEIIKSLHNSSQNNNFIVTRDSYFLRDEIEQAIGKILQDMRMFSIPVSKLLRLEGERVRFLDTELRCHLEKFLRELNKLSYYVTLERSAGVISIPLDYSFVSSALQYSSLGEILQDSIQKKYDYDTYYQLAATFSKINYHNKQARYFIEKERKKENESLKQNALDVVDRNLCNSQVLGLYEEKELLTYREHLLESMRDISAWNISKEQQNILKLVKIDQALF